MSHPVTHSTHGAGIHGTHTTGTYSGSKTHPLIPTPKGFLAVRILQLLLGIVILGLTAFLINRTIGFTFNAEGLAIFTSLATLIIGIYAILAEERVMGESRNHLFALLALEIFAVIFWLATMANLAYLRSIFTLDVYIYDYYLKHKRDITYYAGNTYLAILTTVTVLSAVELILFAVSLGFISLAFHRYRLNHLGGHGTATTAATGTALGHMDPEKHTSMHTSTPAPAYPSPYGAPAAGSYQQPTTGAPYQQQAYHQQPAAAPYEQQQQHYQQQPYQQPTPAPYQQAPTTAPHLQQPQPTYGAPDSNGMYGTQPTNTIHHIPHQSTGGVSPIQSTAEPIYTPPHSNTTEVPAHPTGTVPSATA